MIISCNAHACVNQACLFEALLWWAALSLSLGWGLLEQEGQLLLALLVLESHADLEWALKEKNHMVIRVVCECLWLRKCRMTAILKLQLWQRVKVISSEWKKMGSLPVVVRDGCGQRMQSPGEYLPTSMCEKQKKPSDGLATRDIGDYQQANV